VGHGAKRGGASSENKKKSIREKQIQGILKYVVGGPRKKKRKASLSKGRERGGSEIEKRRSSDATERWGAHISSIKKEKWAPYTGRF